MMTRKREIYADHAAATPVDPRVLRVVRETEKKFWQNPSAIHSGGQGAYQTLVKARTLISDILFAHPDEIVFTSGGTESNNLTIAGTLKAFLRNNRERKPTLLASAIEHPSVIETMRAQSPLADIELIPVDEWGHLNLNALKKELKKCPILLSFSYVNGEIGTLERVRDIIKTIRLFRKEKGTPYPYVHIDATQGTNVFPIQVNKLGIDLMTLDGAKIYGPRGSGLLYVRREVKIEPIIYGGGQEMGLRSGTENLPAIVGLAKAIEISQPFASKEFKRLQEIQRKFLRLLKKNFPRAAINGPVREGERHPGNVNVCFPGMDSEQAVLILDRLGIKISSSSSCQSLAERSNSYVVSNLGKDKCALSSLRFSFGRQNTEKDLAAIISSLKKAVSGATAKHLSLGN
ncbi:MAG TPA: cysteine desulfurase family protein [Candidatus Paceibacterota bacterium]